MSTKLYVGCKRKWVGKGEEGEDTSLRLTHTHVEMNTMCLKSISVVISFPKIIFEIEHYECKSRMMHADVWDNPSNVFPLRGGGGLT